MFKRKYQLNNIQYLENTKKYPMTISFYKLIDDLMNSQAHFDKSGKKNVRKDTLQYLWAKTGREILRSVFYELPCRDDSVTFNDHYYIVACN